MTTSQQNLSLMASSFGPMPSALIQSDLEEKSKAVGRMHELYLTAQSVTSWFGMGDGERA
jgi:hypothetical protein